MGRLDISLLNAVSAKSINMVNMLELELDEPAGTVRITDAGMDLTWQGNTYTRAGHLMGIGDIDETTALLVNTVTVTLSGVDQALTALVLQEYYIDRTLRIWRGFLDHNTGELVGAFIIFEGRVDKPALNENPEEGTSTLVITAASSWVDFERTPGRRTNHDQQQQFFPGDLGFQFASEIFRDLPWGRA